MMFQSKGLKPDFTSPLYNSLEQQLLKLSQFAKHIITLDYKTANQSVIHHSSTI